ncbi:MAG: leucine-rich repeat domain-containing protein, partial [Alistipes sp.]|nr:leucine-rich repeat domain-containing protein [Alistipes sp.]
NYRTNIYGQLLTSDVDINVVIKPAYDEPAHTADALFLAAAFGGEVTLTEDVVLKAPLKVQSNMVLNLNGKTITTEEETTGRHHYAILNYATLVIEGEGAINARGIKNFGTLIVDGNVTITNIDTNGGAAIWNEGKVTINKGTFTTNASAGEGSYGAALNTRAGGEAIVNGGTFEAYSQLTYAIVNEGKTIINNATVKGKHGAVAGAETGDQTTINGGSFELMENPGVSDHCVYKVSAIYGGKFSLGNNTDCGGQLFYESTIATGYKSVAVNGVYHILPEVVADAATAANVTAVTESTADVATALATNNGEATMFLWNDVAYIAKYGEVVITSSAEEATTSRGVIEGAAALTSATVSEGIEVVGNRTFRKCAELVTVALPSTLTEIASGAFQSCTKLTNITIPAGVTTIGEGAFAECVGLTSINIPNGVTRLEKDVLRNTGLTSIEIPASVTYIGHYAFRDCESLTEVKILSPEFTIEVNSFTNVAAPVPTMTIYVVNAEMKAYLDSVLTAYDKSYITVVVM